MRQFANALTVVLILGTAVVLAQFRPGPPSGGNGAGGSFQNSVRIETRDGFRYIISNGIPDHNIGRFPNRGNPNSVRPQNHAFRMTLDPQADRVPTVLNFGKFGMALNGVPFDPNTAEFYNNDRNSGWRYDALSGKIDLGLDFNIAHVQPTGAYHYHGLPKAYIAKLGGDEKSMLLLGYAADGFPIYTNRGHEVADDADSPLKKITSSYRLKKGRRQGGPGGTYDGTFLEDWEYVEGAGDLDECNGRVGVTPEYPRGTYHYSITDTYPFISRAFRGTPDESFTRGPGGPGGGGPGGRPPGPPPGRPPFRQ